jgi:N6-adenosine-specific RNA methylase IME4
MRTEHLQPWAAPATADLFGVVRAPGPAAPEPDLNAPDDSPWPADVFAAFAPMSFDLIMADPPWHFATHSAKGQGKGAAKAYRTWTLDKVKRLPVGTLAAGDAVLFLWATSPLVLDTERAGRSPVGEVIEAWGFRYGALGGWAKKTVNDRNRFGTGYVVRSVMEPFFIATTGSPQHSRACANLISGLARRHSEKPEAAYAWCETYMPRARRIEICSRTDRKGWAAWGDECGKFGGETTL